tara:strand:- start:177 stop:794 length:618 start_codon:yes stop_codon:yes gene_type:complete
MFLILDFTQSLQLALINNNQFESKEVETKKNISEILIVEIDKFLNKSKVNINKIKSICVITGPGSFTGIRSALTFAKSLRLTSKLDIVGISKFEVINFKTKMYKKKCILLHFKNNQFFIQSFKGNKALHEVRLLNFDNQKFRYNKHTLYIYDNILLEKFVENKIIGNMKKNFHLVKYSLTEIEEIILKNTIDNADPKPLYISDYF